MALQTLSIAWQGVWSRLGRSILTALSLFVGVLAIVIIQAGAGAARDAVLADSLLSGGRVVTLAVDAPIGRQSFSRAERLRSSLSQELAHSSGVSVLTVDVNAMVAGHGMEMTLVRGDLLSIRPFPVTSGSWMDPRSGSALPLVLNEEADTAMGLPVGSTISMRLPEVDHKTTSVVVGVVDDGFHEPHAYAPLELDEPWTEAVGYLKPVRILLHAEEVDPVRFGALLRAEYARAFESGPAPMPTRLDQEHLLARQLATVALIFSAVAALSLVVGSLGILNIGLATLRERSDELSLRRSFGATKRQVAALIVLEGQIVALGAAGVALAVGYAVFPLVASAVSGGMSISRQSFPIASAAAGILASCGAALVGSLAPATRASHVPIASIMRA